MVVRENGHGPKRIVEGIQIEARNQLPQAHRWSHNPDVLIHVFDPQIALTSTVFSFKEGQQDDLLASSPFLVHRLPKSSPQAQDQLWPPRTIPATTRVKVGDVAECEELQISTNPRVPEEFSCSTFKMHHREGESVTFGHGQPTPSEGQTTTWSTLVPQLYIPSAKAPFNGIFVGDTVGHGPEFFLIMQQQSTIMQQQVNGRLNVIHSPPIPDHRVPGNGPTLSGSLVAVKLTGNEDVPRGCLSWVVDDLGTNGLVRMATEWPFAGAPIIKGRGVVSASSGGKCKLNSFPTSPTLLSLPHWPYH